MSAISFYLFSAVLCLFVVSSIAAKNEMDRASVANPLPDQGYSSVHLSREKREKDTSKAYLTHEERKKILEIHNQRRGDVTPNAANMLFLRWNMSLEIMAQAWAKTCKWEHGQVKGLEGGLTVSVGQNLYTTTGAYDVVKSVNAWDKEKQDYTYSTTKCASGKVCGHYTAVTWAKTDEIGCGIQFCPELEGFAKNAYYVVCNYYPPGNYKNAKNYQEGTYCSSCPSKAPKCEKNLCRRDPFCSGLPDCAGGATRDMNTCLCNCPKEEGYGGYCQEYSPHDASPIFAAGLLINIVCIMISKIFA